jgi:hypothetical protein
MERQPIDRGLGALVVARGGHGHPLDGPASASLVSAMRLTAAFFLVGALVALPAPLRAADTQTVALVVTEGSTGAFVPDLAQADVAVFENGEPREVLGLERDERPLSLAVILDTSEAIRTQYRLQVVEAVAGFLPALPAESRFTVWATGERPQRILEPGDKRPPQEALMKVFTVGGNTLLDALVEAGRRLERQKGYRRAIVAVTGAGPGYASWGTNECVNRVRKSQARVLGVLFHEGESAPVEVQQGRSAGAETTRVGAGEYEYVLSGLARATGGHLESLPSVLGLAQPLARYSSELQGQYRLRYATVRSKGPRNVQVRVTRPGLRWRVVVDSP